jgi:hypothetical protein
MKSFLFATVLASSVYSACWASQKRCGSDEFQLRIIKVFSWNSIVAEVSPARSPYGGIMRLRVPDIDQGKPHLIAKQLAAEKALRQRIEGKMLIGCLYSHPYETLDGSVLLYDGSIDITEWYVKSGFVEWQRFGPISTDF